MPTSIKYIAVEIISEKNGQHEVYKGLLRAVSKEEGDTVISLQTSKDTIIVFNMKYFGLLATEHADNEYKYLSVLTCDGTDQQSGIAILEKLYLTLINNGFGMSDDNDVIDIAKFTDVPAQYAITNEETKTTKVSSGTTNSTANNTVNTVAKTNIYERNAANGFTQVQAPPKELVPASIKRTRSKKPSKAQLTALIEKLDMIRAGTYIADLPVTSETVEGTTVASTAKDPDDYEEMFPNYMC